MRWGRMTMTGVTLAVLDDDGASAEAQTLVKVAGCLVYGGAVNQGKLESVALTEASGLAVSRGSPGVLWTHNDSDPEGPRLYTFTSAGARYTVIDGYCSRLSPISPTYR